MIQSTDPLTRLPSELHYGAFTRAITYERRGGQWYVTIAPAHPSISNDRPFVSRGLTPAAALVAAAIELGKHLEVLEAAQRAAFDGTHPREW